MALTESELAEMTEDLLRRIADQQPKVHCLTNTVAEPITANALLALGAVPSLTSHPDEMPQFLRGANALLVNLGTPSVETVAARRTSARIAQQAGMPWVLDPVMIDRSDLRRGEAVDLLTFAPSVLRANAAEVAVLGDVLAGQAITIAETGAVDVVRDAVRDLGPGLARVARLTAGHPMLARITATGCALSAVIAAFVAVLPQDRFHATLAGLTAFGAAGSAAAALAQGPGSLAVALLDQLSNLTAARILAQPVAIEFSGEAPS